MLGPVYEESGLRRLLARVHLVSAFDVSSGLQANFTGREICPRSILLAKICYHFFFAIVAKEIMEKKLRQKITYKYRKNRRNNKSNKNQDLGKKKKPRRTSKCPQISQKSQK